MANLREVLIEAAASVFDEGVENSKEIISQNVTNFDNMGMANVNPGEFADGEITDKQNLVNAGEMSNDTDFEGKATNTPASGVEGVVNAAQDLMQDLVDLSAEPHEGHCPECDNPDGEACKCGGKCHCHHPHHKDVHVFEFGESTIGKYIDELLEGKTCEQWLMSLTESNYPGPRLWNPDTRINTSDVLNTLKHEIGEGSEGIHVDQVYDELKNNAYKVSQVDKKLLPKKIQVETNILELGDDNIYYVNKTSDTYPLPK